LNKCLERELICPVCRKDPTPIHPSYTVRRIVDKYRKLRGLVRDQLWKTSDEEKEIGNNLYKNKQYADAIKHYSNAINHSTGPVNSALYANRAACYIKLKQYLLAIEDCDRSIQLDSSFVKSYIRKANCHEYMKNYHLALKVFKEARQHDKDGKFKAEIEEGIIKMEKLNNPNNPPAPKPQPPPPQQQPQPVPQYAPQPQPPHYSGPPRAQQPPPTAYPAYGQPSFFPGAPMNSAPFGTYPSGQPYDYNNYHQQQQQQQQQQPQGRSSNRQSRRNSSGCSQQ